MTSAPTQSNSQPQKQSVVMMPFLVLSLLTGLINAFISPVMSYFLVEEIDAEPIWIGVYTISVTLCGLVVSQYLGHIADKGVGAKKLYLFSSLGIACAMLSFANATSFIQVLLTGLIFMSIGAATMPQMLTIARQWADTTNVNIVKFNSSIRASISLSWVIGPPIAFLMIAIIGFSASFYIALACVVITSLFIIKFVPTQPQVNKQDKSDKKTPQKTNLRFNLISIAVLAGASSNSMYTSSMPLFVLRELSLPEYYPGLFMGLVAALEIPIMLSTSRLSTLFGRTQLMFSCFIFGAIFYLGVFFATQAWQLVILQFVNAIFYGLFAGIGLTMLQEQLPDRVGYTSAIYSNAIKLGVMIGSTGTGLLAQFYSFQSANLGAAIFAAFGLTAMILFILDGKNENNDDKVLE